MEEGEGGGSKGLPPRHLLLALRQLRGALLDLVRVRVRVRVGVRVRARVRQGLGLGLGKG